jgi:putative ubiquitin-RnfH superfamily antitoxin RatB of RatAB toxin-antitoxin module
MTGVAVTVIFSPGPRQVREWALVVARGTPLGHALNQLDDLPAALVTAGLPKDFSQCQIGIWGRLATVATVLRQHDRIEIYRALTVDPKVARRERFQKQGRRSAGLFVRKNKA